MNTPRVLSIAGTDPTGGAGIQADLKSIGANGGYGMAVVTALVAQNTRGVRAVHTPPAGFLRQQLDSVSEDVEIDAVKIGMLGDPEVIAVVAAWLDRVRPPVVVIDPVMVATSGDRLLTPEAELALQEVFPFAGLLTPNVPELAVLAQSPPATNWDEAIQQALAVSGRWGVRVLAKGGHLDGDVVSDALVDASAQQPVRRLDSPRIRTSATHGTGCSLSSAVATWQPVTGDWFTSLDRARRWLAESLRHGESLRVGEGHGPVSHFAGLWERGGLETSTTAEWWERIAELRKATETDPFLVALADGSLEKAAFADYLAQDAHYLEGYATVLSRLAGLAPDAADRAFWEAAAETCRTAETELHRDWAGQEPPALAPVTREYLDHLVAAANSGYGPGVAAVLPCYWMYSDIGNQLAAKASGHPYQEWIDMYADPVFRQATRRVRDIADRVAASATAEDREAMWQAFGRAAQLERDFFAAPLSSSPAAGQTRARSSLLA